MRNPKKLLNNPAHVCEEQLDGMVAACGKSMQKVEGYSAVVRADLPQDRVLVLTGGGSGHEPMFSGYVGSGLAGAAALGDIFTSPAPVVIMAATREGWRGKGALFIYGNYAGDNMNFDIAAELLEEEGLMTRTVRVNDDIASAPQERASDRRGVAGDMIVLKIAGASAERGDSLEEVHRLAQKANDHTRTIGVALSACSLPQTGAFNFHIPDDELELGMGIHGEAGVRRQKMQPADLLVGEMVERLMADHPLQGGERVCVVINNLGASTYTELLIANRKVHEMLEAKSIAVHDTQIGNFCTSQEMAGYSITLFRLDEELQALYDAPCSSFAWRK